MELCANIGSQPTTTSPPSPAGIMGNATITSPPTLSEAPAKRRRRGKPRKIPRCRVPGCTADLTVLKTYNKRYRICPTHHNALAVRTSHDQDQRFCQKCGYFHDLTAFEGNRHSCRERLSRHNQRRRKVPAGSEKPDAAVPVVASSRHQSAPLSDLERLPRSPTYSGFVVTNETATTRESQNLTNPLLECILSSAHRSNSSPTPVSTTWSNYQQNVVMDQLRTPADLLHRRPSAPSPSFPFSFQLTDDLINRSASLPSEAAAIPVGELNIGHTVTSGSAFSSPRWTSPMFGASPSLDIQLTAQRHPLATSTISAVGSADAGANYSRPSVATGDGVARRNDIPAFKRLQLERPYAGGNLLHSSTSLPAMVTPAAEQSRTSADCVEFESRYVEDISRK